MSDLIAEAQAFLAAASETRDVEIFVRDGMTVYGEMLQTVPKLVRALLDELETQRGLARDRKDDLVIAEAGLDNAQIALDELHADRASELAAIAAKQQRDAARITQLEDEIQLLEGLVDE